MKDSELWRHVTRNVTPYRPQRHPTEEISTLHDAAVTAPDPDFSARSPSPVKRAPLPLKLGALGAMDKRNARRFKRGDMPVDGRIDLHGLTLEQAHGALGGFIRRSFARGARCLIVVTGKGGEKGPGSKGTGKIRREVPEWLAGGELRSFILAVTEARPHHGGGGALYVLLKRARE